MRDALAAVERLAMLGRTGGMGSMDVKCQVCESKGRVADEARERAVLWVCGACETRYLVSASGVRKAPAPPPARARVRHTTDEAQVLFTADQVKALRSLAPRAPRGTPAAVPALASGASPPIAAPTPAVEPPVTPLPSLPPVQSLYSVTAIPVRDPLWRRPALLGGALAGLLVGLAAWGVGWGREHVWTHAPSITAALAAPESAAAPRVDRTRDTIVPNVLAPTPPAALTPEPAAASREAAGADPRARRSTRDHARAATRATSRGAAPATDLAEPTEPASPEPPIVETSSPTEAPAPEALAAPTAAAAPPLADAIAAAAAKGAPVPPLADAPAGQTDEPAAAPFSRDAALAALGGAASAAARCRSSEGPFGAARVAVTFSPAGTVTTAIIEGAPFAGTPVGSCIARAFRGARVSPFSGGSVTVHKSVTIF